MDKLSFEEIYEAYNLCLKNKKKKLGTYKFVNNNLCENLMKLVNELNERTYIPKFSNCYVITQPALREIYAAQFSDRIVQHFYMKEIEDILEDELVEGCCSCRKGKGTDYALGLLKKYVTQTSNYGKKDCFFLKIDLSGYFMSIDRKQVSEKFLKLILNKYNGKHKEILIYLTPLIFENNPALNCEYKCNKNMREQVPERRKMKKDSEYGILFETKFENPAVKGMIEIYKTGEKVKINNGTYLYDLSNRSLIPSYNACSLFSVTIPYSLFSPRSSLIPETSTVHTGVPTINASVAAVENPSA